MRQWLGVVAAMAMAVTPVMAAPVVVVTELAPGGTQAAKQAAKAATLAGLGQYTILEDFENVARGGYTSLATGVGTFSITGGNGTGGACIKPGGNASTCDEFHVLNAGSSPFSGRYNTTVGGQNWFDSNDITGIKLDLLGPNHGKKLTNLFFFMTDVNDQGGRLKVTGHDGTLSDVGVFGSGASGSAQTSGDWFFVHIFAADGIASVEWVNDKSGDGWGVDDFGTVPEPLTLLLMGVGFVGVASRLRRRV